MINNYKAFKIIKLAHRSRTTIDSLSRRRAHTNPHFFHYYHFPIRPSLRHRFPDIHGKNSHPSKRFSNVRALFQPHKCDDAPQSVSVGRPRDKHVYTRKRVFCTGFISKCSLFISKYRFRTFLSYFGVFKLCFFIVFFV